MTIASLIQLTDLILIELLLFSAFWFLIGALDDFLIDIIWIIRRTYRKLKYYRHGKAMTVCELPDANHNGRLAIFIPTWQESAVIGDTLSYITQAWRGDIAHIVYVGCYPNDKDSIIKVQQAATANANIRVVICDRDGPTTKADCLNNLWAAMVKDELSHGYKNKAVILHDAEDMVHPDELKIYHILTERNDAVQIPVIPIGVRGSPWISGHYCDEFAESHGKSMVVREALGVPMPLAGVGCAIKRSMLGRIARENNQNPFDASSLTEDYELGLKIGNMGGKSILVRVYTSAGELVGTRACFPSNVTDSVRQKTRWLLGIALAGWDRVGWNGNPLQLWMLLRDRKSIFAAIVLTMAYFCIILAAPLALAHMMGIYTPKPLPDGLKILLFVNGGFLFWRLLIRAVFVYRIYGAAQAAISIPRTIISNAIAIMAARRAMGEYLRYCFGGQLKWDKTEHIHFPDNVHLPANRDKI